MQTCSRLAVVGCLLGAACSDDTPAPKAPPVDLRAFEIARAADAGVPGPTEKERAVAESYASALAAPQFAGLRGELDSDVHFAFPGMGDERGPEGVLRAHDVLFGAFDERRLIPTRVWRTASEQTLEWTMTGVQARAWMGVAPSGKRVVIEGVTLLWTKDDGSLTDIHAFFDVAAVRAQIGAPPPASPAGAPVNLELWKELALATREPAPATPPVTFEEKRSGEEVFDVDVARRWLSALENNDEAGYLALLADDVRIHTLERPRPLQGKEEARAYARALHGAIGQLDTTIDNTWGVADFVIVEYFIAGDQIGPLGWIPAQRDRVVRLECVDVIEMRLGKIAVVHRYDNPGEIVSTIL